MTNLPFSVAILAGGLATRLRPISEQIPKSLIEIAGEPFVYHQLRLLQSEGIESVTICAGHLGEMIEAAVGDGTRFDLRVTYSLDGPRLLGTAGALKKALPLLDESFFVLYGDSYLPCDYRQVQTAYVEQNRPSLMTVFQNDGRWDSSNVEYAGGQILDYDKARPNPRMHYIDYGLGMFHRSAFDDVPDNVTHDLAALYRNLLLQGKLAGFEVPHRFYEIGSFAGIEELRMYFKERHKLSTSTST